MSANQHPCTGPPSLPQQSGDGLLSCVTCGAYQRRNPETGNLTWIRNGRVIAAAEDLAEAKRRHDERYGEAR